MKNHQPVSTSLSRGNSYYGGFCLLFTVTRPGVLYECTVVVSTAYKRVFRVPYCNIEYLLNRPACSSIILHSLL